MLKVSDVITKGSINSNYNDPEELLKDTQDRRTEFERELNKYTKEVENALGEQSFDKSEWVEAIRELVTLNTKPHLASDAYHAYEWVADSLMYVSRSATKCTNEFKACMDRIGLRKTVVICSVDFYQANLDAIYQDKVSPGFIYLLANLYYHEQWIYTKWRATNRIQEVIQLGLGKSSDLDLLESTQLLQDFLMVFDSPKQLAKLLKVLGNSSDYLIKLLGELEGKITIKEKSNFTRLLAVLNDILKGIVHPNDQLLYDAIFLGRGGLTQEIITDILSNTPADMWYYESLRRYFKYALKEYELRSDAIKGF